MTFDCGGWEIKSKTLHKVRSWELHLLRKIIPIPFCENRETYLLNSAAHLDETRQKHKQPHALHLLLDEYFRSIYRNNTTADNNGRQVVKELRKHRNQQWWNHTKAIPHYIRAKMKDSPTQRRTGTFTDTEQLMTNILGDTWQITLDTSVSKEEWMKTCRASTTNYLTTHRLPIDPRQKQEATPENTTTDTDNHRHRQPPTPAPTTDRKRNPENQSQRIKY